MELFLFVHQNYKNEKWCGEIESLPKLKDESIDDFNSKISQAYYRFNDDDQPLKEDFI